MGALWAKAVQAVGGSAPRAKAVRAAPQGLLQQRLSSRRKLVRAARRLPSLRDLVGSDGAMMLLLEYLGPVACKWRTVSLKEALAFARVLPGVHLASEVKIGRAEAVLLAEDTCMGSVRMSEWSSWVHALDALKVNTGLRKLETDGLSHTKVLAEALAVNESLEELTLHNRRFATVDTCALWSVLRTNRTLRVLSLQGTRTKYFYREAEVIGSTLTANAGLQEMDLSEVNLSQASARAIAVALRTNTTLQRLTISLIKGLGCMAAAAFFKMLLVNRTLLELILPQARINKCVVAIAKAVHENRTLQVLDLSDSSEGRSRSFWMPTREPEPGSINWPQVPTAPEPKDGLLTLRLRDCGLTHENWDVLALAIQQGPGGARLRDLCLWSNSDLGDAACSSIISACLAPGSTLRRLDLGKTGMDSAAGLALAVALQPGPQRARLEDLCLRRSDLEDDTWGSIISACLAPGSTLRRLDLEHADMGDAAGLALASGLRANHTLQALNLAHVSFFDMPCWPEIFAALAAHPGLQTLILRHCKLRQCDVEALVAALRANCALREIDLEYNELVNGGARDLAAGLATNTSLRKLNLRGNGVDESIVPAFITLLQTNATLRVLTLGPLAWRHGSNNKDAFAARRALKKVCRASHCSVIY